MQQARGDLDRRYERIQLLGKGTSGEVYLARDTLKSGRLVAIKELRDHDPDALETFVSEFTLLSALRHPCLVETYDFGGGADTPHYFTMEYVSGGSLADRDTPLPVHDAIAIIAALLEALLCLHESGCAHFDVKPSNVLLASGDLDAPGAVKLADFGLSGRGGEGRGFRGTPAFAAPELIRGEPADGRADLYSLGAVACWMLTGAPPFAGPDAESIMRLHVEAPPPSVRELRPEVPEAIDTFVARLMGKLPAARFESTRAAAAAFAGATADSARGAGAHGAPSHVASVQALRRRAPFVGRRQELEWLQRAVASLGARGDARRGVHLIRGESGIGKSRLVDELRIHCQTRDVPFLSASVSAEGRAPLAGMLSLLPQLRAVAGESLVPADALDPAEIVVRVAAVMRRPFVVFLDDIESADAPTVDALRTLARAAGEPHSSFLLVAALREDAGENRKLEETLYILSSENAVSSLTLAPLDEGEVAELIIALAGREAGATELATRLVAEIGGLPLVVTTALETLIGKLPESASPALHSSLLSSRDVDLASLPLPENLRDAVTHRLDRQSPLAQALIAWLSVSRSPLSPSELARLLPGRRELAGDEVDATLELIQVALAEASVAHLLREPVAHHDPGLEVSSALVRNVTMRRLSAELRQAMHRDLATSLSERGGPVEEIAYHAIRGEDAELAAASAAITGRRFLAIEDHARAREHLEAALKFEVDPARRTQAALDLATALQRILDSAALRAALTEIDESRLDTADLVRFHIIAGEAQIAERNVDAARTAFTAAAASGTGDDLITSLSKLSLLAMRAGDMEGFKSHVDRIFEVADASGDPEQLAQALTARGHYHRIGGRFELARDDYERSVELLAPRGPSTLLRQAYHHLAWLSGFLDEDEQALEYYRRSTAVAQATGVIGDLARSHRGLGYVHIARGEIDIAERHLKSALEINDRFGGTERGYIFWGLAQVHLERADYSECQRVLDEARREAERDQHAGLLAEVNVCAARVSLALGRTDAVDLASEAGSFFDRLGDHISWESAMVLGRARLAAGDDGGLDLVRDALVRARRANRREGVARSLAALADALPAGVERTDALRDLIALSRTTGQRPHTVLAALAAARDADEATTRSLEVEGESIDLDAMLDAGLAAARAIPEPEAIWRLETALAMHSFQAGDLDVAGRHLRLAHTTLEEIWRQLPDEARERFMALPEQSRLARLIEAHNQAVAESRTGEPAALAPGEFALPQPASSMPPHALETRQPRRRLEAFYEVSRRISAIRDPDRLLSEVLNLAIAELDADRGIVFLIDEDGGLAPAIRRDLEPAAAQDAGEYSRQVVERVASGNASILHADAQAALGVSPDSTVMKLGITSLACVPMRSPTRLVGTIYVDSRRKSRRFAENDLSFLAAFGDLAAVAIENAEHTRAQDREIHELRRRIERREQMGRIVGASGAARAAVAFAERAAASDAPVLLLGPTGTGKEQLARAIHAASDRASGSLVVVDCTTLPPALAESELFGHIAGAFTDARDSRDGLLVEADGGAIFFDEIGELPLAQQGSLLRFLQEGEVRPVGSSSYRKVSTRVMCATHRDLQAMVQDGEFRQDLYYRIDVLSFELAPLSSRREDIPLLVEHFLEKHTAPAGRRPRISARALAWLTHREWSGNIRELENAVRGALALESGAALDVDSFGFLAEESQPARGGARRRRPSSTSDTVLQEKIEQALTRSGGNARRAADLLGLSVRTLYRRFEELGIDPRRFRPSGRARS